MNRFFCAICYICAAQHITTSQFSICWTLFERCFCLQLKLSFRWLYGFCLSVRVNRRWDTTTNYEEFRITVSKFGAIVYFVSERVQLHDVYCRGIDDNSIKKSKFGWKNVQFGCLFVRSFRKATINGASVTWILAHQAQWKRGVVSIGHSIRCAMR